MPTTTVVPVGAGDGGVKPITGLPSTVKATLAESPPGVPVTVITAPVLATTATPT
jgi:hypothetical protein